MKRIIWDPMNGLVLPDGRVEASMPELLKVIEREGSIAIGSGMLFTAFRVHIKRNALKDFVVVVHGEEYMITHRGTLPNWPYGLDHQYDDYLSEMLH